MACKYAVNEGNSFSECSAKVFPGKVSFGTCMRCEKCTDPEYYEIRVKKVRSNVWSPPPAGTVIPSVPVQPVPYDKWPIGAKTMALARNKQDKGVGDTIHRLIPKADELITFLKRWNIDCGCSNRRASLNARFPYG